MPQDNDRHRRGPRTPGRGSRAGAPGRSAPRHPAPRTAEPGGDGEARRGGPRLAPKTPRLPEPAIPEGITGYELDRSVRSQLRTLSKENAEGVAQHLVAAAMFLDSNIEAAEAHAETAVRRAGRVPAAREALGLVAYHQGDWARALREFRTARRLSGSPHLLPYLVDCERGLGRPERALDLATSPEARRLATEDRVELAIVVSGVRLDLGQRDAAVVGLQVPELRGSTTQPWWPRLAYAYAQALLATGDDAQAREWFGRAAAADTEGLTDAEERVAELDGVVLTDLLEDESGPEDPAPGQG